MVVSGKQVFDFLGRSAEQFYPVTEPKGDGNFAFNPAVDSVRPTRTSYDVLDRPTRVTLPDDTASTTAYGFGPDRAGATQFETITTDANGKQRRAYTDVRELTTAVKEFNPEATVTITYTQSFSDPAGSAAAAQAQFGRGIDVVWADTDAGDSGIFKTAARTGNFVIGYG